jgi:uncharacterized protein (TIGR02722 family)
MRHSIQLVSLIVATLIAVVALNSCGRRYAKGEYIDTASVILRSDKFVESDLKIIAERLAESLLADKALVTQTRAPVMLMSLITNSTDEHIDMKSLSDKIRTILFKSGKMQFINESLRPTIKEEIEYEEGDFVDPRSAKRRGRQVGADYLISGNIAAIKQPVGRQEIVYYKATLEMTNLTTNIIAWTDEVEIRKHFRKKFTGY